MKPRLRIYSDYPGAINAFAAAIDLFAPPELVRIVDISDESILLEVPEIAPGSDNCRWFLDENGLNSEEINHA